MKKLCLLFPFAWILAACTQGYQFDLPPVSQSFGQRITYNNKIDVVFVVDNSTSMMRSQSRLSAAVVDLTDALVGLKMDFHIGVTSTSMGGDNPSGGRFIGTPKFLTSQTPLLAQTLAQRILLGEGGSNLERGLDSLLELLGPTSLGGAAEGFLRTDALLVVIALSDEDDNSVSSAATVTSYLETLKPAFDDGSRAWMLNFIGVLSATGPCQTMFDNPIVGTAWMSVASSSGGLQESVCSDDFSSSVSNIRARIIQVLTDFPLPKIPRLDSIRVRINGVDIPRSNTDGWDYLEEKNALRFYGAAVPPADAEILVDFKPAEAN